MSEPTEMETRVAKALYADQFPHLHLGDLDNAPHFLSTMLRRARVAIRAMGLEWRTIQSAPKEGFVLLYFNSNNINRQPFITEGSYFSSPKGIDDGWETAQGFIGEPTHWMPLPDDPSSASETAPVKESAVSASDTVPGRLLPP